MIHVAYRLWGGDGFYAKMCGTSMLSMFENTKEKVTVHIMHNDRLTPDNRGKLCYIAGQYNQQIDFRNVEKTNGGGVSLKRIEAVHPSRNSMNVSWYPLIIHEIFPELDKLIFLGADTIFNSLDVAELWAYDLKDHGFASVQEYLNRTPLEGLSLCRANLVKHEDYFIDDVMLLEPAFFRENFEKILEGVKFIWDNKFPYFEQDALNYLYSTKYLKLPLKFDTIVRNQRLYFPKPLRLESAIYHFAGTKPDLDTSDIFNSLYLSYFMKTPWATVDMLGNLDSAFKETFKRFHNNSKDTLMHFTNLLAKRKRAFLCDKELIEPARKFFEIDDELIFELPLSPEQTQKFLSLKGQTTFIIFTNYPQIRLELLNHGFVENLDFVDAGIFLSERHGVKFNFSSIFLAQAL